MTNKDSQLEFLSAHYSETFSLLKSAVERRDRLFLYILIVIVALLLYMSAPTSVGKLLNSFVSNQVTNGTNPGANESDQPPTEAANNSEADTSLIGTPFIGTILLLGLLSLTHTYFQTVLHIERQYDYVYQLESLISPTYDRKAFIREGDHYRANRKKFATWTKFIFWYLFPSLLVIFNCYWFIFLRDQFVSIDLYFILDCLFSGVMLISLVLYVLALLKKK